MSALALLRDTEARRIWFSQASGVFLAACAQHSRPRAAWMRVLAPLVIQAAILLVLALIVASQGATVPRQALVALPVGALVLLVLGLLVWLQALEADVLREVEQRTLDVLTFSPLPGSAFLAGKLAFFHWQLVVLSCGVLPTMLLGWACSAWSLASIALSLVMLHASGAVHASWLMAEAFRSGVVRRDQRRPMMRWSGLLTAFTVMTGLFLVPALAAARMSGTSGLGPWMVLAALLPAAAVFSAGPFPMDVHLLGKEVPLWLPALAMLLALLLLALGSALHRWKPQADSRGGMLRAGMLALFLLATVVAASSIPGNLDAFRYLLLLGLLAVLGGVPAWAGLTELADVGVRQGAASRVFVMCRASAGAFTALVLGGVACTAALVARPATTHGVFVLAAGAFASLLPSLFVVNELIAFMPRSRVAAWIVGLLLPVACLLALGLIPMTIRSLATSPNFAWLVMPLSILETMNPLLTVASAMESIEPQLGAGWSGSSGMLTPAFGPSIPYWLGGPLLQLLLAFVLVRVASRRASVSAAAA